MLATLVDRQLDLVVTTQRLSLDELDYRMLLREAFWLVTAPGALPTGLPSNDPSALESRLSAMPWIADGPELPLIRRFWRQVFGGRPDFAPRLVIPDLRGVRAAVAAGLGVSVLPDYLCAPWVQAGRLACVLSPSQPVENELWLAYRKENRQAPWLRPFPER